MADSGWKDITAAAVGSAIALAAVLGLLLERVDGAVSAILVASGLGVGFTPRFVAAWKARSGK